MPMPPPPPTLGPQVPGAKKVPFSDVYAKPKSKLFFNRGRCQGAAARRQPVVCSVGDI